MASPSNSPARLAAVSALAVSLVIFVIVVVASLGGSDGDGDEATGGGSDRPPASRSPGEGSRSGGSPTGERTSRSSNYVVKPGDNLVRIAEKTGVPVETLQELNPSLDPQALVSGQRVKLRE